MSYDVADDRHKVNVVTHSFRTSGTLDVNKHLVPNISVYTGVSHLLLGCNT